jgi:membrane fusion protein (multidrug efflux system)
VLTVGTGNKVERHNVVTGPAIEQSVPITTGLQDGARVIVEGGQKVRPGEVVNPIPESTRPQGAAAPASPAATTGAPPPPAAR